MTYGYSQRLAEANRSSEVSSLGIRLGRLCIKHEVPVNAVAKNLGVSRSTIYNWFWGVTSPHVRHTDAIVTLMHKLKTSKK